MKPVNDYFMDDPREASRLTDKVRPDEWVNQYLSPYLSEASQVLDIGCGPGVILREVAHSRTDVQVTGIDFSEERISQAQVNARGLNNAQFQVGNATALPFEANSFDLVYSRFLLEYLAERQQAVNEMVRVCRTGGRVLLQDLDGQLLWHYPPDEEMEETLKTVISYLAKTGFDPFVGRKLFALAQTAKLEQITVQAESYHLYAGKIDAENLRLWDIKLDIAMQACSKALGGHKKAETLKQRCLQYLQRDDTLTYSIVFTVSGVKGR